ncbi:MAG TPA: glycerophosphodiester phosphodiesterase family protein [Casimicrobiaceae bacterium]|nr:glycerophosphodiester phosphodiesterase family protein [Casimicrobiaceae bacterium]
MLPWTVNDRSEMSRLIDLGVDGIITDYPELWRRRGWRCHKLGPAQAVQPFGGWHVPPPHAQIAKQAAPTAVSFFIHVLAIRPSPWSEQAGSYRRMICPWTRSISVA